MAVAGASRTRCAHLGADLAHGVAVAQRGRVRGAVHGVEVDGDAEGHADLVRAGVAPADGPRCVVHLVRDAGPGQCFGCREQSRDHQGWLHSPTEAPRAPMALSTACPGCKQHLRPPILL